MGRAPCCDKVGLKKGPWTPEEDQKLVSYIQEHGHGSWRALPQNAGLLRCGKSCRLRWTNYLRPDIKRGNFSVQEEQTIIQLHALLGNRWSTIAQHLPKRTDNEIKNYWNTHLKKRLSKMGIDPVTHKPKSDSMNVLDGHSRSSSALSHMAQWESARLEAEVRLARQSRLGNKGLFSIHGNVSSHASLFQNNDTWKKEPLSLHVTTRSRCLDVLNAKLLSSGATNTNSCLTVSTNSTHLMESPTSSLTFVDGAYNRQSSDTSGDTNTNYLSMLQTKQQPESSPFQIPVASSPLENKPSREDLSRFLLGTDNNGDQSSNPGEHGLLFPGLHDMMLFPSDHHCSSTPSVSSPEEQSPANDMSNHGDDTTNFEGCFNEDLLLDLDDAPNCELAECPEPEEEPHKSIMHRDYWNNILNMVNSPGGHNSSVPSIF